MHRAALRRGSGTKPAPKWKSTGKFAINNAPPTSMEACHLIACVTLAAAVTANFPVLDGLAVSNVCSFVGRLTLEWIHGFRTLALSYSCLSYLFLSSRVPLG